MESACVPPYNLPKYCRDVYEPAEDSYLLLDALRKERSFLEILHPTICVEIGCGTGVIFTYLATLLHRNGHDALFLATDVNPTATVVASQTAALNKIPFVDVIRTDLLKCIDHRLEQSIDVLIFNPPYVPTPSHEVKSHGIEAAWAGGVLGREVIDRILPRVKGLLSPSGVLYMIVLEENRPNEIMRILQSDDLDTTIVLSRKCSNEKLYVLKAQRRIKT
uniref:Uncharacterized protein AlNc14C106G6208 n=1 Tax=Albugo laibachii Nc14 TaxID=890382 RepID=F0WI01_9STRA|nr:conserved hypothetical protein [Albugo laibachii Nc14]|eukprot:CCA20878.1 conserved hypothetical protein [Albugo laibachii Nc14]